MQPAFLDYGAKKKFNAMRSADGKPMPSTENQMHEKQEHIQDKKLAHYHTSFPSSSYCMYSAQGNIICQK